VAGVGQTGYWRSGVWVEPLDAEGDFALSAEAGISFEGYAAFAGVFTLEALADTEFEGAPYYLSQFALDANADTDFAGLFIAKPGQGIFGLTGTAEVRFSWTPFLPGPGGGVIIPDGPAEAIPELKPGDAVIFRGTAGICALDSHGRLVVVDQTGTVMCIIGPSGVELP